MLNKVATQLLSASNCDTEEQKEGTEVYQAEKTNSGIFLPPTANVPLGVTKEHPDVVEQKANRAGTARVCV